MTGPLAELNQTILLSVRLSSSIWYGIAECMQSFPVSHVVLVQALRPAACYCNAIQTNALLVLSATDVL